MDRQHERYYRNFERPPFAPIYYPSEEEFSDPIGYVAKIKHEAEKYGVVKIIPPASFRPPFAIDAETFEFMPRVQRLNEIDALFRVRIIFINKLVSFWYLQGHQFRLPYIENKYIDLFRLRHLVKEHGGLEAVNEKKRWSQISKTIGFKPTHGSKLKDVYIKWISPFIKSLPNEDDDMQESDEEEEEEPVPECSKSQKSKEKEIEKKENAPRRILPSRTSRMEATKMLNNTRGGGRMSTGGGRMSSGKGSQGNNQTMAGGRSTTKAKPLPTLSKKNLIIEQVFCNKCHGGDDEAKLLICETCEKSTHTYCLDPPLSSVPKGEWRCQKCVADTVQKLNHEFGFHDSNMMFNLNTFAEYANNFKQEYFKKPINEVQLDDVEREFWRNVINFESNVITKYGADLITSKVGSGFPRKNDDYKGMDLKARNLYANHPWNLNNLPVLKESVLSHMNIPVSGMMVPWVYVGMCFSTFCWHVEDHWTYSINYLHWGERKIWYGVPGSDGEQFDNIVMESVPELFRAQPDLLHHMITALNPSYLMDKGVKVYTVHQNAGEFVITFPRAYHSGFNEGYNFAEAVNFAPSDWIHMGRLCLTNYAKVKRHCVFSHEELVMRMVEVADKISIGMCLATIDELRHVITKESHAREYLAKKGLSTSDFTKFEDIPDDQRSCVICQTTLYMSGLECRHKDKGMVCMDHIMNLCEECPIEKCVLKYRYTLKEMLIRMEKLKERTTLFEEWKQKVHQIFNSESGKYNAVDLRECAETWKTKRYPQCDEIRQVHAVLQDFDKLSSSINKILTRKRLRDITRIQKADTRYDFSELESLRVELQNGKVVDERLQKSLEALYEKINNWKQKANDAIEKCLTEFNGVSTVDLLLNLHYEGEEFDCRLEELTPLKNELSRCQWLQKSSKYTNWQLKINRVKEEVESNASRRTSPERVKEEVEDEQGSETEDEVGETRFSIDKVQKVLKEGDKWMNKCNMAMDAMNKLHAMIKAGLIAESKAEDFLDKGEGIGFSEAEAIWEELLPTDWLDAPNMNVFRKEFENAKRCQKLFDGHINSSNAYFSILSLDKLEHLCAKSSFQRNSDLHKEVLDLRKDLHSFVSRICHMFLKSPSYYNLFEIISGREDLLYLVQGDPVPLAIFNSKHYADNWSQLKLYDSSASLTRHLSAVHDQQIPLLFKLRELNERRSLKETCSCSKELTTEENVEAIACYLCKAKFHGKCARWEPFLNRMLPGIFLCPRCLRGRRPCIEDVEVACEAAPKKSLEFLLVDNLLRRSSKAFNDMLENIKKIPIGSDINMISVEEKAMIETSVLHALSLEIIDMEAYNIAFSSSYFQLFPIPESQVQLWRTLQSRMVDSALQKVIFPGLGGMTISPNRRYKRHSSGFGTYGSSKKKQKAKDKDESYHGDKEECSADKCLKPYSDHVRWIQCESGCMRWYHYVCVGQTVKAAQEISKYTCYRCLSDHE